MSSCKVIMLLKVMPVDSILLYMYIHTYIHMSNVVFFFLLVTINTSLMHTILCSLHFKNYFEIHSWKQLWSSYSIPLYDLYMLHIQCMCVDTEHKSSFIVSSKVYLSQQNSSNLCGLWRQSPLHLYF